MDAAAARQPDSFRLLSLKDDFSSRAQGRLKEITRLCNKDLFLILCDS
jgi:hypothetical protein